MAPAAQAKKRPFSFYINRFFANYSKTAFLFTKRSRKTTSVFCRCATKIISSRNIYAHHVFFWGFFLKRKSVKGILVSIDSATNDRNYFSFNHFFFAIRGTKKKFPKRNAECAHAARAPLCVGHHLCKGGRNNRFGAVLTPRQLTIFNYHIGVLL